MRPYTPQDWYWFVGGDLSQAYSSEARGFVAAAAVPNSIEPSRIASMDELIEVLRVANVPPYHSVSSALIVDRLKEAGVFEVAYVALHNNPDQFARFYTRGYIHADNVEARAFLTAIGADPDVILAPEAA